MPESSQLASEFFWTTTWSDSISLESLSRSPNVGRVSVAELPLQSLLRKRVAAKDFLDCYSVESNLSPRKAVEIMTDFPGWARFLLSIRSVLTAPFGLSRDGPESPDKVGVFPVVVENSRELIAGFNDKHLDFRVSVLSQEGRVFLATWVHTHNAGGQAYLRAILPFHVLIARDALARVWAANVAT